MERPAIATNFPCRQHVTIVYTSIKMFTAVIPHFASTLTKTFSVAIFMTLPLARLFFHKEVVSVEQDM
jgi:hypothetical protein